MWHNCISYGVLLDISYITVYEQSYLIVFHGINCLIVLHIIITFSTLEYFFTTAHQKSSVSVQPRSSLKMSTARRNKGKLNSYLKSVTETSSFKYTILHSGVCMCSLTIVFLYITFLVILTGKPSYHIFFTKHMHTWGQKISWQLFFFLIPVFTAKGSDVTVNILSASNKLWPAFWF